MARVAYRIVDVFTRDRFAGNPLAVFADARDVPENAMQRIANELNLSETTFVVPTQRPDCDVRVRIFTPTREVPMAGHPTIGTAHVLARGSRVVFEEGVGPIPVERVRLPDGGDGWRMTQPRPRFGGACDARLAELAARALGIEEAALDARWPVETAATGLPFLVVPLRSLDDLARIRVRADVWADVSRDTGALGLLPIVLQDDHVRCRMVGVDGIPEDPATGSAAGPLGAWLVRHRAVSHGTPARILVRQGHEMGRPAELYVDVPGEPDDIPQVGVAGACVDVGNGALDV